MDKHIPTEVKKSFKLLNIDNIIYACALNMADVISNCNKSYILQLLTRNLETFIIYSRSGRVGQVGQINTDVFVDQDQAIEEFKKIFHNKTGIKWSDRHNIDNNKKGKYSYVILKHEDKPVNQIQTKTKITISDELVKFIKIIYDPSLYSTAGNQYLIDTKKLPLGSLGFTQIKRAEAILDELCKYVKSKSNDDKINTLSSEFYTTIPSVGKIKPLYTEDIIKDKYQLLELLENICYISKNIDGGIMTKYSELNAKITPVTDSSVINMINKYFYTNMGHTHVNNLEIVGMYEIDKPSERQKYRKWESLHNKQLLWHGTPLANAVGILTKSLCIGNARGGMFGSGLYFANVSTKSAGYTRIVNGGYGIMFLCEVALGNCLKLETALSVLKLPKGTHSVLCEGMNRPNPEQHIKIDGNVTVPIGKIMNNSTQVTLYYDEYVVYDASQIKLRYAVIIKSKD